MPTLRRRWAIPLTIIALTIVAVLLSFLLLRHNRRDTEVTIGRELKAAAVGIAARIPAETYFQLFYADGRVRKDLSNTPRDPRFLEIQSMLRGSAARFDYMNLGQNNVYTFVTPQSEGKSSPVSWGVMLHDKAFSGEKYNPPAMLMEVITTGNPAYSPVYLSSASLREWISGYAPIIHRGRIIGVVEVAREFSEILRLAREGILPVIFVVLVIVAMSAVAISIIIQSARTLQKTNAELSGTLDKLTHSTAVSRHLSESSPEIIFALGSDMRVVSINIAALRQLGIDTKSALGRDLTDVFCADSKANAGNYLFDPELLRHALNNLKERGEKVNLTATLTSRLTGEPKDYRIRVERVSENGELSFIGRAASLGGLMVATLLNRTRMQFSLTNSLLMTEEMASFLSGLCRRFVDEHKATTYRIMLREMLINAIEHGNLAISFDEKTQALLSESYFDLIDERRRQDPFKDRLVTIDCLINAEKIAFRIADEGQGFDHRKMIAKLRREKNETAHGRGILMTWEEFDVVRYNNRGNSVTLIKYLQETGA